MLAVREVSGRTLRASLTTMAIGGLTIVAWLVFGAQSARTAPTCGGKPATTVLGDTGADFYGTDANEVVIGGDGDDNIVMAGGRDRVCAGLGNDLVRGEADNDPYLNGGPGRDNIAGGPGDDQEYGSGGSERGIVPWRLGTLQAVIDGGAGNDLLDGGRGRDDCNPGSGKHNKVLRCEE
jgi:Ca2+-binding RTX toxin-like protein